MAEKEIGEDGSITTSKGEVKTRGTKAQSGDVVLETRLRKLAGESEDPELTLLLTQAADAVSPNACCRCKGYFVNTLLRLSYYPIYEDHLEELVSALFDVGDFLTEKGKENCWPTAFDWFMDNKVGKAKLAVLLQGSPWGILLCECPAGPGYHIARLDGKYKEPYEFYTPLTD